MSEQTVPTIKVRAPRVEVAAGAATEILVKSYVPETETQDVLQRLQSNVARLEDMTGRLGHLISELQTLVRR